MEVGIVSEVITIPFGIRNLVFITASQILFLISPSSDIQNNEVENFFFLVMCWEILFGSVLCFVLDDFCSSCIILYKGNMNVSV